MTRILLVRHGETEWNAEGRVQGWRESPLSDRGRAQAALLSARLEEMPIGAVYSSDLGRARETAQALARPHPCPVLTDSGLRERCFGVWEGLTLSEVEARFPEEWQDYHQRRLLDVPIPGAETWEQVAARMTHVLHRIMADHPGPQETVLLIGHGGSLRALILDALAAPLPTLLHLRLDNASLSRLDYAKIGAGRVIYLNDTTYLETKL